jgi:transcriptional regulator with XRE-family HTH domain
MENRWHRGLELASQDCAHSAHFDDQDTHECAIPETTCNTLGMKKRPRAPRLAAAAGVASVEEPLDFARIAADWVRALRGKRTQAGFSRRLGYSNSVVHRWESGRAWPTAARFLQACEACGKDVSAAFTSFFRRRPAWLAEHAPSSPAAVAAFLRQLRGKISVVQLAKDSGFSRYTLARWLAAEAEPRLPQFVQLIEASSRRSLDFIASFTSPDELPSLAPRWARLQGMRTAAYEESWSLAVLRALELDGYRDAGDGTRWLASALGITGAPVLRALDVLSKTEQATLHAGRWVPKPATAVTTGRDPATVGLLTAKWSKVAIERLEQQAPGHYGYSLFAVSRADLRRLRDLHVEYLREMQSIIARSKPDECVGLLCLQLLDLSARPDNALLDTS